MTIFKKSRLIKDWTGRELVCSWHHPADSVFQEKHPGAIQILDRAGCILLLARDYPTESQKSLRLTEQDAIRFSQQTVRRVVIAGSEHNGLYDATMSKEELGQFHEMEAITS